MKSQQSAKLLLCAAALFAAADSGESQERGTGQGELRRAQRPVPNQYIVVLNPGEDPAQVGRDAAVVHGGRPLHSYRRALNGFAVQLNAGAAARLAADPRVRFVEEDSVISVAQVQTGAPAALDRIDQRYRPLDGSYAYGELGSFVRVHVVDSGVRVSHQEFGGRAFIAGDYVDDDGDGNPADVGNDDTDVSTRDGADCNGHGTHVAGIIGGATYGVAKNVTLHSHRVLSCGGSGTLSGALAAIDAISHDSYRPAVVNMSLGGEASEAMDAAVKEVIASGVTFVVAAGNSLANATNFSPARIPEAITVGATDVNDVRAWFSNYGPSLDLFAPGVSVTSAWFTSDVSTSSVSGTSMAAPHAAGVVALYLSRQPEMTPDAIHQRLVNAATPNIVVNPGSGSPNRLLHSDLDRLSAPAVRLLQPQAKARILGGRPFAIAWEASDPEGLAGFEVQLSLDSGVTYVPLPGCETLDGNQRQCAWAAPAPDTNTARIRVVAHDRGGDAAYDQSSGNFSIVALPDLVTAAVSHSQARLSPGSSIAISDTVRNVGNMSSAASTTKYYLSLDAVKSTNDIQMIGNRAVPSLSAETELAGSATVSVPASVAPATYTLLACSDASRTVDELDETNNCSAAGSRLVIEYGDLVTSSVSNPPSNAAPGSVFSVSDTVHNASLVSVSASWTRYYLSADATKDAADLLLTGTRSVSALAAGASSQGSRNLTVPSAAAPGTYRLLACADDTTTAKESNESNNCAASAMAVRIELPDLVTISIVLERATAAPGTSVGVTDTIQNAGNVASSSTTTRYYLSTDGLKSPDDLLFTSTRYVTTIAPGATSSGSRSVILPVSTPNGTYRVLACADDLLKLIEANESNNCRATSSVLTVALPDLAVVSITNPPAASSPDAVFGVSETVHNRGAAASSGWSTVRYYLSNDPIKDSSDLPFSASRSVAALNPGSSSSGSRTLRVPSTAPPGVYYLLACADDAAVIKESDESNNCLVAVTTVTIGPAGS